LPKVQKYIVRGKILPGEGKVKEFYLNRGKWTFLRNVKENYVLTWPIKYH